MKKLILRTLVLAVIVAPSVRAWHGIVTRLEQKIDVTFTVNEEE